MFRLVLICLLCGFLAAGPIPAWVHVASCDHHHHDHFGQLEMVRNGESDPTHGCACSGHDHRRKREADSKTSESQVLQFGSASEPGEKHDAEDCVICKSLASPNYGDSISLVNWRVDEVMAEELSQFTSLDLSDPSSIFDPRGPPVRV